VVWMPRSGGLTLRRRIQISRKVWAEAKSEVDVAYRYGRP
jgi:hypothetical protein